MYKYIEQGYSDTSTKSHNRSSEIPPSVKYL